MKPFSQKGLSKIILVPLISLSLLFLVIPVSAENVNVTFVDPLGVNKISVYSYDGTHIIDITSDSTYELNSTIDYVFHIQPNGTDIMRNPEVAFSWMRLLLPFALGGLIVLSFVMMVVAISKKGLKY